jgi:MFS family permease
MIFQGLAPSFWGPLADKYGRRPIFISTFCVYIGANVGLALSKNYATLMVFRGIQAIGSSATIAIGAGTIGDIAYAGERGGLLGIFSGST